ncbi:DUF397 domain-containing protein [Kitasatospora sp. NPDC097691]|uniref:DUF397 domain-containing protein n=1 Tax=Kitasatospora sp. NPDC097691 TaxID=3157231 RepID=UPI003329CC14
MIGRVDLSGASWVKSTYSQQGGNCLEVARGSRELMPVRDSKDPQGPTLLFPVGAWESFVAAVCSGEFGEV